MKFKSLLFFLILCTIIGRGQKQDSTNFNIKRIFDCIEKSEKYSETSIDSAMIFAKKALHLSRQTTNNNVLTKVYNNLGNCYQYKGLGDSAIFFHKKTLALRLKGNNSIEVGDSYNNLGIGYELLGNYELALKNYFQALRLYEEFKNLKKQAMVLSNIGIVYKEQKSFQKALEYYKKANLIYVKDRNKFGEAVTNGNIGSVLLNLENYKASLVYSAKSKQGYQELKYLNFEPYPISNMAMANDSLKNYIQAENLYKESISGHKKGGNTYEVANVLNAYAKCLIKQKKYDQSIIKSNEALKYIEETAAQKLKVSYFQNIAKAYALKGDYEKAYAFFNQYNELKDTLFKEEKVKSIFELESKYENEKKEKIIAETKADNLLKEAEIKKGVTLLVSALGLAFLLGLIGYLMYKQQRLKNNQIRKESELKQALAEIENQNNLEEQRLAISKDLHDNIGSQLTFIISSLDNLKFFEFTKDKLYAKFDSIGGFTRSTITDLRDTIWAMNKEEITFEDLKTRTANFIEAANASLLGIRFEFNYPENHHSISLKSLQGIDVYRIIQEAVNNAVKHAKATKIAVNFEVIQNKVEITITDNGLGFDAVNIQAGNGMNSMQKRAKEIGGVLSVVPSDSGTKVSLVFDI